ncbi:ATP-binding protein [Serratia sp. BIGb0163]|uniref:ATP-binding protein n=1 Tax=Serratia sp. BIGb0163 TaxID=2940613 RepID=UPI002169F639|nr:ATP-binding protein [Serratia sp. BIGb0163]MCS4267725.1 hypothetical protein [Serratia sp. BIGb0163]
MHNNPLEQIRALRLGHMSNALELQWSQPMTYTSLSFEERLSLLLEHELLQREVSKVRYQRGSTIIISQLPVSEWYKLVGNPTVADALMDRLLHNGHRVELRGKSMRKLAQTDQTG